VQLPPVGAERMGPAILLHQLDALPLRRRSEPACRRPAPRRMESRFPARAQTCPGLDLRQVEDELISESRCRPLTRMSSMKRAWVSESDLRSSRSTPEKPITAFQGRAQLMRHVCQNSDLSWFARSISRFFASSSTCCSFSSCA